MDPREFLRLAKTLLAQSPGPAACRTIVGRSYYAAFNVAVELIKELKIPLDKQKESHVEVLDLIVESKNSALKQACDSLASLKKTRKDADYEMDNTSVETVQKASLSFLVAGKAIERFDQVHSDPSQWKTASDNMIKHARDILKKVF